MTRDEFFMQRCLDLALKGSGKVAPNPMVGAVLVYESRIIGEGYHKEFGGPHAEVNCLDSVRPEDAHLINQSTLYVSLEPCAHFGKTPPCANLIVSKNIPKVVIGIKDPFARVNGRGIEILEENNIEVSTGILEKECRELNRRFFCFHQNKRPYIILKWAQTQNGKIDDDKADRLRITHAGTNRMVHRWRSEEAAIMVGTSTAGKDDPQLTNRLWFGKSPIRMIIDKNLNLPHTLHLFDGAVKTVIFNSSREEELDNCSYRKIVAAGNWLPQIMDFCHRENIQSIMIEGGARLLQSCLDTGLWDEARVLTNPTLFVQGGINAPQLKNGRLISFEQSDKDLVHTFQNNI